jgi:hypothetical protein
MPIAAGQLYSDRKPGLNVIWGIMFSSESATKLDNIHRIMNRSHQHHHSEVPPCHLWGPSLQALLQLQLCHLTVAVAVAVAVAEVASEVAARGSELAAVVVAYVLVAGLNQQERPAHKQFLPSKKIKMTPMLLPASI